MNLKYSVLMSVYINEKADYLSKSIESMINQSLKPDEIILMIDGPLTQDLNTVVEMYETKNLIKVIRNETNIGLGKSLHKGLLECKNEFIARMDSDDISIPNRCEKQVKFLNENSDISVIGTALIEFINNEENILYRKEVVTNHVDIAHQIKFKNPINHPTVMFRKKHVLDSGNYLDFYLNEDYYLWIRMYLKGYKFSNLNENLLKMRIDDNTYLRRGGYKYYVAQKNLFKFMLNKKIISKKEYLFNNLSRFIIRVCIPNNIRKNLYTRYLRKGIKL